MCVHMLWRDDVTLAFLFFKTYDKAEEMAQRGKSLLQRLEDPHLEPQHPHKQLSVVTCALWIRENKVLKQAATN